MDMNDEPDERVSHGEHHHRTMSCYFVSSESVHSAVVDFLLQVATGIRQTNVFADSAWCFATYFSFLTYGILQSTDTEFRSKR